MKTITFYSYKGGVGRSLALSNIAKRLSEFGKKVCLIDFDIEAPGLHHKFKQNLDATSIKNGLVDYIHDYSAMGRIPTSISNYVTKINFENKNNSPIDLIASGNVYTNEYWKKLSSIDWVKLFYKEDSQGVAFFVDLKEKIKKELKPDFLLIDSRTGITEVSGITMSILADEIVLLAARNDENIEGIKQVTKTLVNEKNNVFGKVPKINFVLSRVPYFPKPEDKHKELLAKNDFLRRIDFIIDNPEHKIKKVFIIHSDQNLELNEKFMIGYEHEKNDASKATPIALDYLELFEELTKGKLTSDDKKRFNDIKESEYLIKFSKNEKDINKKIELLKKAVFLNPTSDEAYSNIAIAYGNRKEYDLAIENINAAIDIAPNNLEHMNNKGYFFSAKSDISSAKKIFKNVLKLDKKNDYALSNLGHIYYMSKEYEIALKYFYKIIEYYPEIHYGYNSIGNTLRVLGRYEEAFTFIYKALEIEPQDIISTGTLAELYAHIGNEQEFFKNLELSFAFGMKTESFVRILKQEKVYKPYLKNSKFLSLLSKYNHHISID